MRTIFATVMMWATAAGAAQTLPQAAATENLSPVFAAAIHDFAIYSSALSPFVLVRNEGSRTRLFQQMSERSGPTQFVFVDDHKVKVFPASQPVSTKEMTESWMLFWFNGGKGWEQFDIPILVVLQKLPSEIKPAGTGVEFVFPAESGTFAIVPLYGLTMVKPETTAAWNKGLPDDVAARCRMLAEISREYPIEVQEKFKLFPQQDKVVIRDRFEFMSIDDDWKTPHKKIAPLEYTVALAWKYKFRLLSVSGTAADFQMPTGGGMWAGVEGDECSYTLTAMLRYVNTLEEAERAASKNTPWKTAKDVYSTAIQQDHWGGNLNAHATTSIEFARAAWQQQDNELYRLGCYDSTRQLMTVWVGAVALSDWTKGLNIWPGVRISGAAGSAPGPSEQRFMQDRIGQPAGNRAPQKVSFIWQGNQRVPQSDNVYRDGLAVAFGGNAVAPVLMVRADQAKWPVLEMRGPTAGMKMLPLCGIAGGDAQPITGEMTLSNRSISVWPADYLKKP